MVLSQRTASIGLLALSLWWPFSAQAHTPRGGADPFGEARKKLMAIAPSKLVWENPKGLKVVANKVLPFGGLPQMDLLESLLGTPFQIVGTDAPRHLHLVETFIISDDKNLPLVMDANTGCPPGKTTCRQVITILKTTPLSAPDRLALETAYEYLVDAGLMGANRKAPP